MMEVSEAFARREAHQMLPAIRLGALLGIFAFVAFAAIDPWLVANVQMLWASRAVIVGMLGFLACIAWRDDAANHSDLLAATLLMSLGLGVLAVTLLTGRVHSQYHPALIIIFIGFAVIVPWRPRPAAMIYFTLTGAYGVMAYERHEIPVWLTNLAVLTLSSIVAVIAIDRSREARLREFLDRDRLEDANRRLQELDQTKSRFFANLHHELRTPLTLILAPIQAVLEDTDLLGPDARRNNLQMAHRSAVRLLHELDTLLDLTKLGAKGFFLDTETFDLVISAEQLVEQVRPLAERKQLQVRVERPDGPVACVADRFQIERVLLNLLTNAIKFTHRNGSVIVRVRRSEGGAAVEVVDNGIGIPPEHLSRVFDQFHQVDSGATRRHSGSGIGLALARELVELHGGRIWAQSVFGSGATVSFWIPNEPPRDAARRIDDEGASGLPEWQLAIRRSDSYRFGAIEDATERRIAPRGRDLAAAPIVLVAEDNHDMARFIASQLASDYAIVVATDGRQALEMARKHVPDLVLTDVMMPELDGFGLTAELRRDPALRDVPIVMLTARGDPTDKITAGRHGVDHFLTKPFLGTELLLVVRNAIQKKLGYAEAARHAENDAVRTLALGIAHEILNPLGFLQSGAWLLREATRKLATRVGPEADALEAEAQEAFEAATEGVDRIRSAVDDLRRFAQGAQDDTPWTECSIDDAVRQILSLVGASGGIAAVLGDTRPVAMMRTAVERLVLHLVVNARQAGGPSVHIRLVTREDDAGVVLTVSDDGPGIPATVRDRIFTPFFTTRVDGSGMGLAMARQVAWQHGGSLNLDSSVNSGATFVLRLPHRSLADRLAATPVPAADR